MLQESCLSGHCLDKVAVLLTVGVRVGIVAVVVLLLLRSPLWSPWWGRLVLVPPRRRGIGTALVRRPLSLPLRPLGPGAPRWAPPRWTGVPRRVRGLGDSTALLQMLTGL